MSRSKTVTIEYIHPHPGSTQGIGDSKQGDQYEVSLATAEGLVRGGRSQFWKIVPKIPRKVKVEDED
jgi:hypothetical protein